MKPMLLTEYPQFVDKIKEQKYLYIQPKLNGWRCLINTKTGELFSRNGNKFILPHISAEILSHHDLPEWLDGELYIHGKSLTEIQSLILTHSEEIQFHIFDIITFGNFGDRLKIMNAITETETIQRVQTNMITPGAIKTYYKTFLKCGLEGAVIRLDTKYEQKRSCNIFKLKPIYD